MDDEDGNPTIIYCKPNVMFEMRKWWAGINKDDVSVFVDIIIAKAEDAEGQKMFTSRISSRCFARPSIRCWLGWPER